MPKIRPEKKFIHPHSRKASQLSRKVHHVQTVRKLKESNSAKSDYFVRRYTWFQKHLDPEKSCYTKTELAGLTKQYLNRFSDELEQIGIVNSVKHRVGRQHASREDTIAFTIRKETSEFESSGLEVPDLINSTHFKDFLVWDRKASSLPSLKTRLIKRSDFRA